jgi:hypothetical protein
MPVRAIRLDIDAMQHGSPHPVEHKPGNAGTVIAVAGHVPPGSVDGNVVHRRQLNNVVEVIPWIVLLKGEVLAHAFAALQKLGPAHALIVGMLRAHDLEDIDRLLSRPVFLDSECRRFAECV